MKPKEGQMDTQNWFSVSQVAEILNVSDRHVRRLCEAQKLTSIKDGKSYQINPDSVYQLKGKDESIPKDSLKLNPEPQIQTEPKSEAPPTPSPNKPTASDIRTSKEDNQRTSDIGKNPVTDIDGEVPADIYYLAQELVTSVKTMQRTSDMLIQRIWFEHKRNEKLQKDFADLLQTLRLPAPIKYE